MKTLMNLSYRALLHKSAACFLVFCMLFVLPAQVVYATPTNPDVVGGSAGVTQTGNTTNVDVLSSKAIINWDSLDTNQAEILQFLHAGGNFAVLNRVMQGGATQFNGSLFGNQGTIIIVNPNGIVFGPTALVQAYSFTASSLDMSNADFMNGVQKFTGDGVGEISNYGNISAQQVALIGKKVLNAGTITSPGGYTIMASGDSVYLVSDGSSVAVEVASVTVPDGSAADGLGDVINEGTIDATDGKIIMAAGDTYARAIEGLDTLSLGVDSGVGRVGQFGTATANGTNGDGGSITLTAADAVVLGDNSVTTANAGTNGNGGEIVAYSPDTTLFSENAAVEAKGGSESGNGGFVEVSGKDHVEVWGQVDTTAAAGEKGTFLIDPTNIKIDTLSSANMNPHWDGMNYEFYQDGGSTQNSLSASVLQTYLANNDVIVKTDEGGTASAEGWIWVAAAIEWYSDSSLTLDANGHITIDQSITNTGNGAFAAYTKGDVKPGNITVNADVTAGSVTMQAGDPTLGTAPQSTLTIADGATVTATSGNADLSAREHIQIDGDVIAEQGNINVIADSDGQGRGNVTTTGTIDAEQGSVAITGRDVTVDTVHASNNIDITALEDLGFEGGGNATTNGLVSTDGGDITVHAVDDITINGPMETTGNGNISMYASGPVNSDIFINDAVTLDAGSVSLNANDDIRIRQNEDTLTPGSIKITGGGDADLIAGNDIEIAQTSNGITLDSGKLTMLSGRDRRYDNSVDVQQNITAGTIKMEAGNPAETTDVRGNIDIGQGVTVTSTASSEGPAIDMSAREHIQIDGDVIAKQGDISILADSDTLGRGNVTATGNIDAEQGSVDITGRDVTVNTVHAADDIKLTGLQNVGLLVGEDYDGGGNVTTTGLVSTDTGDIDIMVEATPGNTTSGFPKTDVILDSGKIIVGDNIDAGGNVTLHNQTEFNGNGDQHVVAETGTVTAKSTLTKTSEGGSLYLHAGQDVSLADDVTNNVGGVSVIADNGKISTPGSDALNVGIEGYSDYLENSGVDLPDGSQKAAIVLQSHDTLTLGENATLHASGYFISSDEAVGTLEPGTDDRSSAGFLQEDGAIIGGYERNPGIPSDIAIYAGSTAGDVVVESTDPHLGITVDNYLPDEMYNYPGSATVVLDAHDTVTLSYLQSLTSSQLAALIEKYQNNPAGFRLEVVSQGAEWLYQVVQSGALPFAANPGVMEALLGADYVLRGAGQGNPAIVAEEDGRAWVLENPPVGVAAPLEALNIPELKGCPVEMDAAATELSMNTDQLQLLIGNSLATNPNLQPCEACQRLVTSAGILNDADGARLAAMNEIFNTLAPADAPFTPEIQANIATAFANLSSSDSQYALANEYVNAFVQYVAVIGNDLKAPVGDPVAYALEKHGGAITTDANPNVAAYIMAQANAGNL